MSEDELPDPLRDDGRPSGEDIVEERKEQATPQNRLPDGPTEQVQLGSGDNGLTAKVRPGTALYRAVVLLLGTVGASAWVWASKDAADRAPAALALFFTFFPAFLIFLISALIALHGAKKHADDLHPKNEKTPPPSR